MTDCLQKPLLKRSLKIALLLPLVLLGGLWGSTANADACTYREAIMALEKGNDVRGLALMRMASRDGDRRADNYLMEKSLVARLPGFVKKSPALKTASLLTD